MVIKVAAAVSRAEVDTSRPFQSVREAVEVFGERYAGGGSSNESSVKLTAAPAASSMMLDCLKKLEADLAQAKAELVQLKQRQSQMAMAVSGLSMQFNKGLSVFSGLSKGKEVAVGGAPATGDKEDGGNGRVRSDRWDESRAEEWMASLEYLPSLSQALSIKMVEDDLEERKVKSKKKVARKKHKKQTNGAISLVVGIFSKKDKSR